MVDVPQRMANVRLLLTMGILTVGLEATAISNDTLPFGFKGSVPPTGYNYCTKLGNSKKACA